MKAIPTHRRELTRSLVLVRHPFPEKKMTRLIRAALLVAAGIWIASPSTAQAQNEVKTEDEVQALEPRPNYEGYMEIVPSRDVEPGTLIVSRELEKFLGKTIQVHHKASDTWPTHFVLRTLLVSPSGRTIGQCISEPAALVPGEPMSFPDVCMDGSLLKGLKELGVETLTIEKTRWVDGKPVNLGLWARENLDKSSIGISIIVTPEKASDGENTGSGTFLMALKYPIEHG